MRYIKISFDNEALTCVRPGCHRVLARQEARGPVLRDVNLACLGCIYSYIYILTFSLTHPELAT